MPDAIGSSGHAATIGVSICSLWSRQITRGAASPIAVAAIVSSVVSNALLGNHTAVHFPEGLPISSSELPWFAVLGALCGGASLAYIHVLDRCHHWFTLIKAPLWVKPAVGVDTKRIDQLIKDLDSNVFDTREKAAEELEKLGELANPALEKVLQSQPSLETRQRIERLQEKLVTGQPPPADVLRAIRAVRVLQMAGTPEARDILIALAFAQSDTNDMEGAIASMRKASELRPDANTIYLYGRMVEQNAHLEDAVALMRRALAIDPKHPPARLQLARDLFYTGHGDEAVTEFRRLIISFRNSVTASSPKQ